jgi:putative phage-type endonuclease
VTTAAPAIDPAIAELVLPPGADRPTWLAARRDGLGGSEVSTLVGLTRYESPYELWLDKTGQVPLVDEAPSEAAEMGTLLEPVVRDRFARLHSLTVHPAGTYRSREWPWMFANPDGIVSDGYGYEGKTCSQWVAYQWKDGQTADHAELQAQWGMAVTGLPAWHIAVLIAGQHNEYRLVERDDELIGVLVDVGRRFWHDHVLARQAPAWDGSDAAVKFLTDRYQVAQPDTIADVDVAERDRIAELRAQTLAAEKTAEVATNALKNHVRALIGEKQQLMCGDKVVATWKNTGQFSRRRFVEAHPDLAAEFTRPVTVDELDIDALAAAHPDLYTAFRARRLDFKI